MAQQSSIQVWKPFEMVVDTTIAGSSGVGNFEIPLINAVGIRYRFLINWGDGLENRVTTWNDPSLIHTYTGGTSPYTIKIYGKCDAIGYNFDADSDKILDINSWGNIAWESFAQSFNGSLNLSGITSTPPIVERLDGNFLQTFAFSPELDFDMGLWDSDIVALTSIFRGCSVFNNGGSSSISGWTTTNCTSMSGVFDGATLFNQPVGSWNVGNVTNTASAFKNASTFDQDLSSWNVGSVQYFSNMFEGADSFDQDLSSWDVSNGLVLANMFKNNTVFNNSGSTSISGWTTSACTNMASMFYQSDAFNQPIDSWDVSQVTTMDSMFFGTAIFNQPLNTWDVSSVITMEDMFNQSVFDQPLNNWVTSGVTNMSSMFDSAIFNQDIGSWDVSNVDGTAFNNGFQGMFSSNSSFNNGGSTSISGWTFSSNPVTFRTMFFGASSFNQPIGSWNVSNVTNMQWMLNGASIFNQDLSSWDVSSVTDMSSTFAATSFNNGGSPNISGWTVTAATDMGSMFANSPFNQPIGSWDVSTVTQMDAMFSSNSDFNQPLNSWDTSNVQFMNSMFQNSISFNQDISSWDVSSVTNMSSMLLGVTGFNQDISGWNVSGVTNMIDMLDNTAISLDNYNSILTGWTGWDGTGATKTLQSNVTFGVDGLTYSTGTTADDARNYLLTGLSWTINGDIGV